MYNSPIELLVTDIQNQIVKQQDEEIYKAVLHYIPNVDKEELIRALQYDRNQYEKGYADGKAEQKWISVTERLPEKGEVVLACGKRHATSGMFQGASRNNPKLWHWKGNTLKEVTHWMPLPEPPKEVE